MAEHPRPKIEHVKPKPAGSKETQMIELKRVVMVKAIVTEAFKTNLQNELERAIKNLENQAAQMETQSRSYIESLKQKGLMQKVSAFRQQLEEEGHRIKEDAWFVDRPAQKIIDAIVAARIADHRGIDLLKGLNG